MGERYVLNSVRVRGVYSGVKFCADLKECCGLDYKTNSPVSSLYIRTQKRPRTHINPLTAMMALKQQPNLQPLSFFVFFFALACYVKGFSSKCIALKVDVIGPKNMLSAGGSVHFSARKCYRLGQ